MPRNVIVNITAPRRGGYVVLFAILIVNLFALPIKSQNKITEGMSLAPVNETLNKAKSSTPLARDNVERLALAGQTFAQASKPVSASLLSANKKLSGSFITNETAGVVIKFSARPKVFRADGSDAKFNFSSGAEILTFTLEVDKNSTEIE